MKPITAQTYADMLNAGITQRREKLAGQLWPDTTEANARDNLRHALWRLRKALESAASARFLHADDVTIAASDSIGANQALSNLTSPTAINQDLTFPAGTARIISMAQETGAQRVENDLFSSLENARVPVRYMSRMLSAGNDALIIKAYQKMIAVRIYKRAETVGDVTHEQAATALA